MENKKPWESKTVLTGALMGLLPLIPAVGEVVQQNPQESVTVVSLIMIVLRFLTGGKVAIK